ncbi:hypothetical protein LNAOJCKE_2982 [Methylorubrum aminovorans]|uniref:Minor tail protein n=1 Tax=Methylorubrum aminovorans TaxID=269069 RepID=A0ABQ4UES6_9HYPH|nr:hypothetical protein [Methylorubrum aminovorans]GJE65769.1 hypothetical protein LNAOJCKE_2982 [Methylorubrum aminovorans]GMA75878.1 hypothetical protein GCM10025880_22950 [Methylorubrum aminovorans]
MTIFWPLSRQQVLDLNGRPRLDVRASFFQSGSNTPLAVYADPSRTQPHPAEIAPDAAGRFPRVYLPEGLYREQVYSLSAGLLWSDDGLGEPIPPTEPTDPDGPDDPTARARTGDVKWRLDNSVQPGWVRMNQGTIGNGQSGASERGHEDTRNLYLYLWLNFPDSMAPVVGGRGASAGDDFAAGKVISILTMQGLLPGGLDDMGTGPANRLQTSTVLNLTAGSTSATAFSGNRLAVGMSVIAPGISAGTTIADINGNAITLSQPAAAGSTGAVLARFSFFGDVQTPGQIGGDALSTLSTRNLPTALPDGKVTVDYPAHQYVAPDKVQPIAFGDAGASTTIPDLLRGVKNADTTPPGPREFTVSHANPSGGQSVSNLPPIRLGTFYLKL